MSRFLTLLIAASVVAVVPVVAAPSAFADAGWRIVDFYPDWNTCQTTGERMQRYDRNISDWFCQTHPEQQNVYLWANYRS